MLEQRFRCVSESEVALQVYAPPLTSLFQSVRDLALLAARRYSDLDYRTENQREVVQAYERTIDAN